MLSLASEGQSHTQGEQEAECRPSMNCQYKGGPTMYTDNAMANNTSSNFSSPAVHDLCVVCAISKDLGRDSFFLFLIWAIFYALLPGLGNLILEIYVPQILIFLNWIPVCITKQCAIRGNMLCTIVIC